MIAAEMRTFFDLLQDVSGNPWFSDAEKDLLLEDVIWDYINDFLGDVNTPPSLEQNKSATAAISTLINPTTAVNVPSTGILTDTLINAALSVGDIIIPVAIELTNGEPVHFVRHNDIGKFEDNTYKAGISLEPNYTIYNASYQFYPKEAYTGVIVTALTKPTATTDLPEHKHWQQVAKAMAKTGYVTESQALVMMGKEAKA
jgi:hypothetical protein